MRKKEYILFACCFGSLETPIILRIKLAYSDAYRWQCLVHGTAAIFRPQRREGKV